MTLVAIMVAVRTRRNRASLARHTMRDRRRVGSRIGSDTYAGA
jgi:hypothetical protein